MSGSGRTEKIRKAKNVSWEEKKAEARSKREFFESTRMIPTVLHEWSPPFYLPYDDENGRVEVEFDKVAWELIRGAPMVEGRVTCREVKSADGLPLWYVRISFWGDDDTFLGKSFNLGSQEDAMEQYHRLVTFMNSLAVAQYSELLKLGFNAE